MATARIVTSLEGRLRSSNLEAEQARNAVVVRCSSRLLCMTTYCSALTTVPCLAFAWIINLSPLHLSLLCFLHTHSHTSVFLYPLVLCSMSFCCYAFFWSIAALIVSELPPFLPTSSVLRTHQRAVGGAARD